jgi:hypothetical protein
MIALIDLIITTCPSLQYGSLMPAVCMPRHDSVWFVYTAPDVVTYTVCVCQVVQAGGAAEKSVSAYM